MRMSNLRSRNRFLHPKCVYVCVCAYVGVCGHGSISKRDRRKRRRDHVGYRPSTSTRAAMVRLFCLATISHVRVVAGYYDLSS